MQVFKKITFQLLIHRDICCYQLIVIIYILQEPGLANSLLYRNKMFKESCLDFQFFKQQFTYRVSGLLCYLMPNCITKCTIS